MEVPSYDLPPDRIAQIPAEPRDSARLLDASVPGEVAHRSVHDLPALLGPGDLVVLNSSRVIPARFHLTKASGGAAEVLLLDPIPGSTGGAWRALVRPGRRLPPGTELFAGDRVVAVLGERLEDGVRSVQLVAEPDPADQQHSRGLSGDPGATGDRVKEGSTGFTLAELAPRYAQAAELARATGVGEMPLPPYIHQALRDPERYQTVYAETPGSVAAPTAGLHLTDALLAEISERGARIEFLDLAVGLGTFRPVTSERAEDHDMHAEHYAVPERVMEAVAQAQRVVAVGTTTTRALETAAATGRLEGESRLYIHGDFPWRVVDLLVTNFHQPRSTLLLLLEAFCGPGWRDLYRQALEEGYRFLSFGDAMVVARGWSDR